MKTEKFKNIKNEFYLRLIPHSPVGYKKALRPTEGRRFFLTTTVVE